jgi:alpha-beta hydrolase superfamily lysophospholipase
MISEPVEITAADGHCVCATVVRAGAPRLVVLAHGITTGKDEGGSYTTFAEGFLAPDFDSIRFDFRGHGESAIPAPQATVAGELLDLMAVFQWARAQGYHEIFHLASSFGGSITLLAMQTFDLSFLAAAVLWNPVVDYTRTFIRSETPWARQFFNQAKPEELAVRPGTPIPGTGFVIGPLLALELMLLRPQDTVWPPAVPLLLVHGTSDRYVPFATSAEFAARHPAAVFLGLDGIDHGFGDRLPEVFRTTATWLRHPA